MKKIVILIVAALWITGSSAQKKSVFTTDDYVRALKHATDIMVNDVTSPVAASRYYAYITLTGYETFRQFDRRLQPFSFFLKGFSDISVEDSLIRKSYVQLATIVALYKSASRLLPSGKLLLKNVDSLRAVALQRKLSVEKINSTFRLADRVVEQVIKYAYADGFVKLSGLRRFTPTAGDEYWKPTAPGFMAAIEPNWNTLRTFVLDSCSQFAGDGPNKYSADSSSLFFKQMIEVYEVRQKLSKEQADIAMFWDCNPFALQQVGHLEFGIKKISPGGHWMGITGIACKKDKLNLRQTAFTHAHVAIGIADAFIACWDNKYKYNRVRPVTAIQKLIGPGWSPLLQTPPFPEYTSGHSVISTTAAVILTDLFGNHFSFADDTEVEFGLPVRTFASFEDASKEAAISRLYGGIHFRDAIENGVKEGKQIGDFIVDRMRHGNLNRNARNSLKMQSKNEVR